MKLLVLVALCGMTLAGEEVVKEQKTDKTSYDGYSKKLYHGMFPGKCQADGFYYKDEYTFVMCSNGHAFEQHCAPGSMNSGYEKYATGVDYYIHEFCDVNMVGGSYSEYEKSHMKSAPSPAKPVEVPNKMTKMPEAPKLPPKPHKAHFMGKFSGKCGADGFYYYDENSFVMCSNGNAYVQRCAPGSRNSGMTKFQHGDAYYYSDFCDVNMVDYGYGNDIYAPNFYPNPRFFKNAVF